MPGNQYDIDERRLRIEMLTYEPPYNEEAWQKFEKSEPGINHANSKASNIWKIEKKYLFPLAGLVALVFLVIILLFVESGETPVRPPVESRTLMEVSKPATPKKIDSPSKSQNVSVPKVKPKEFSVSQPSANPIAKQKADTSAAMKRKLERRKRAEEVLEDDIRKERREN
jgi:hypothetical protein